MGKAQRAHHLFSERTSNVSQIASPIRSEQSSFNEAMEAAVRPIGHARDVAMFHRIEVDVVDVSLEIFVVPDGVLPVPALPNAFFPFDYFAW